ncbi:unnamed protein product [Ranitomeya imitator]|uniref:Lysosome-associated membrane glycoprotein 2-like luminal domain-containing protein n=1 Tax=Ranitomeya imitator TaxID=111125 RepID=A0ABN9LB98_9NEOB|nr:unnamed protein product [Ranitomeya imitator]
MFQLLEKRYLNIKPKETNANGTCGASKSNLLLQFPEGFINFTFVKVLISGRAVDTASDQHSTGAISGLISIAEQDAKRVGLNLPLKRLSMKFAKRGRKDFYYIQEVSVQLHVASEGRWNGTSGKLKLLSTDVGYSVACKRTPTVKLADNLELVLAEVKLQAFDIKDGNFGKGEWIKRTLCK